MLTMERLLISLLKTHAEENRYLLSLHLLHGCFFFLVLRVLAFTVLVILGVDNYLKSPDTNAPLW